VVDKAINLISYLLDQHGQPELAKHDADADALASVAS
jgi:hypothetical protein